MIFGLFVLLVLVVGWVVTLIGMPGNWIMAIAVATFTFWGLPDHGAGAWTYAAAATVLAIVGEAVEFGASAAGMSKGGSKRGAVLAMIGATIGSLVGAAVGLPIPIIGSIIGIVICSALGAMLGAMLGEVWKGRKLEASVAIGRAAFWGPLIGTGAKLVCGSIIFGIGVMLLIATLRT